MRSPHAIKRLMLRGLVALHQAVPARRRHYERIIFKLDRIGDFFMSCEAIARLVENRTDSVLLIVSEAVSPAARELFPDIEIVALPYRRGALGEDILALLRQRRLAGLSCEELVCLRHQRIDYHNMALALIRTKRSWGIVGADVGAGSPATSVKFTDPVPTPAPNPELKEEPSASREQARHATLLESVLHMRCTAKMMRPSPDRVSRLKGTENGGILIAPLASSAMRDIPAEALRTLLPIIKKAGLPIRFCAAPYQQQRLKQLVKTVDTSGEAEISTQLTLPDYIATLLTADAVISADSASAHLATCGDMPLLAFLGGGHYGEFAPWRNSDRQQWLTRQMDCFGCSWACPYPTPYCLSTISESTIVQAASRLIASISTMEKVS